jgi:hypothetical protein
MRYIVALLIWIIYLILGPAFEANHIVIEPAYWSLFGCSFGILITLILMW